MTTCPTCGQPTQTEALRFLHDTIHREPWQGWNFEESRIAALMEAYAAQALAKREDGMVSGRELRAIKRIADEYDEFDSVFDQECNLPPLASRVYDDFVELLNRVDALKEQIKIRDEARKSSTDTIPRDEVRRVLRAFNGPGCHITARAAVQQIAARLNIDLEG